MEAGATFDEELATLGAEQNLDEVLAKCLARFAEEPESVDQILDALTASAPNSEASKRSAQQQAKATAAGKAQAAKTRSGKAQPAEKRSGKPARKRTSKQPGKKPSKPPSRASKASARPPAPPADQLKPPKEAPREAASLEPRFSAAPTVPPEDSDSHDIELMLDASFDDLAPDTPVSASSVALPTDTPAEASPFESIGAAEEDRDIIGAVFSPSDIAELAAIDAGMEREADPIPPSPAPDLLMPAATDAESSGGIEIEIEELSDEDVVMLDDGTGAPSDDEAADPESGGSKSFFDKIFG